MAKLSSFRIDRLERSRASTTAEVEIGGGERKKLTIKGGLLPSPNAAAQAGAIDPGQSAIMSQPGGAAAGTGGVELPVFRVNRVRGLGGSCQ